MKLVKMLRQKLSKPGDRNTGVTATDGKSANEKSTNDLYLFVSDCGWRARFVSADGVPSEQPLGEELVLPLKDQSASIKNIITHALDKIGKRTTGNVGNLTVVLEDPRIVFVEDSPATASFSKSNIAAIRNFGCEHLGVDEVSYGYAHLDPETDNEFSDTSKGIVAETSKGGVYGFIEVDRLRDYLSSFGDLAPKTALVTPAAHAAILGPAEKHDAHLCHIFVSAYSTVVAAYDVKKSVAIIRSIPVGIFSISDALSKAQGLTGDLALAELQRRDCIAPVFLKEAGAGSSEVPNQFERILGPVVRHLGNEIEKTLSFFHDQRGGSTNPVANIVVHGAADCILGLTNWLSERLSISVTKTTGDCLEGVMSDRPRADFINLLTGAQGPLFKIGKVDWTWDKNKIRSQAEMTKAAKEENNKEPVKNSRKKPSPRDAKKSGGKGRRDNRRRGARGGSPQQDGTTFFGLNLGSIKGGEDDDRLGYGILALLVAAILYLGYTQYIQPKLDIRRSAAITYNSVLAKNAALRREVERRKSVSHVRADVGESDKVLWTEKFLALGCYASEALWLTDVYLTKGSDSKDPMQVRKLIIEGAVLPSYDGHLLEIAGFIRRLEEDARNLFMADFKTITFEGASVDLEDVEEVVKFQIEAWYEGEQEDKKRERPKMMSQDLSIAGCVSGKEPTKIVGQK